MAELDGKVPLRVLFSAHGLPETIVKTGDPYQFQIERTVRRWCGAMDIPGLDWQVCYQSRATPQKWLEPSTEEAIERAAQDKVAVLVVPIAFVSEHSETLVELDVEYRELAREDGRAGLLPRAGAELRPGVHRRAGDLVAAAAPVGPGLCSWPAAAPAPAPHRLPPCPGRRAGVAA